MSALRNLAQRWALRVQDLTERALEIRPGTPLAERFLRFGPGSVIRAPQLRIVGERSTAVGSGVTILKHVCLEAYGPPGTAVLDIGDECWFSHNVRVVALNGMTIGSGTTVGQFATLADTVHDFKSTDDPFWKAPLKLGDPLRIGSGVLVGVGAVLVGGLTIGDGTIIGPNSVVTRDVPSHAMVSGNPPRIVKRRDGEGAWRPVEPVPLVPEA